jgi:hypothetical protein
LLYFLSSHFKQLGKKGARIQELQKSNGIYGIQVGKEGVNGRVKVTIESKTVADAEACREAFELEEHRIDTGGIDFSLATQELETLKTQSGILVAKIESKNHIICIGCRESLQKFHTLFGLEKIYLPDIVTRQKELLAVERIPAGSFRPGGFGGRGGMSHSSGMRGPAHAGVGASMSYDSRPVIKTPRQPQQQPQQQPQLHPQSSKGTAQPQKQPQQQQQKSGRKDRSPDPASIAITLSASNGAAAVRTIKAVSEQQHEQQKSLQPPLQQKKQQQPQPPQPPSKQQLQAQQQPHLPQKQQQQQQQQQPQQQQQQPQQQQQQPQQNQKQKQQQQQQSVQASASPSTQEQKDSGNVQGSNAQTSDGGQAAVAATKPQRPPKKTASSSFAPASSAPSLAVDKAHAASAASSAPVADVVQAAAPIAAASAAASVSDSQSHLSNDPAPHDAGTP